VQGNDRLVASLPARVAVALPLNCPIALSGICAPERSAGSNPVGIGLQRNKKGRHAMARIDFSSLPRENPCAQCGKLIAIPEWIEAEVGRTFYLWRCQACDYRFEAVAYFDSRSDQEALAA
jgi:hypothetical protein